MPEMIENRMVVEQIRRRSSDYKICSMCEQPIYEDDTYYDFEEDLICECCVREYVKENYRRTFYGK